MHQPPAVVWKVARTRFQGGQVMALAVILLFMHGAWWVQSGHHGVVHLGAGAATGAALLYAWHDWRRAPVGHVRWDGQSWSWSGPAGAAQAVVPMVAMDFQFLMLLRLDLPGQRRCWCWVGIAQDVASWRSLRRALFSGAAAGSRDKSVPGFLVA